MKPLPLFSEDYLTSRWGDEFREYLDSGDDAVLLGRLQTWAVRDKTLTETQLEGQFNDLFFKATWGYWGTGERDSAEGFCLNAQYGVAGAGQTGGTGSADLALGWFGMDGLGPVPQVLCEFKDIRSGLDAPQNRKGNNRSPVKQCFDYLKHSFDQTGSQSTLVPTWGVVTDMNEFRLYARRVGDSRCLHFFIESPDTHTISLTEDGEEAAYKRFLFQKVFRRDMLLARHGRSALEKVLEGQWVQEKELEKGFYREYRSYRVAVFEAITAANPNFDGTRGKLVRLTQRFLDRCIFILFCEDMGKALNFPTNLLRNTLIAKSKDQFYEPETDDIWRLVIRLFHAMRDGGIFPPEHTISKFNGGLFEELPELESLVIPNYVFCAKGQGENTERLAEHKDTLLFLSASYNFGTQGAMHERTLTLYALGRIFEQSITELEFMEAEAEGRQSIAALTKRKRDGVYYTPEWVTDYIVKETIGARLADIREELGLEFGAVLPEKSIEVYRKFIYSKRRNKKAPRNIVTRHMRALEKYEQALDSLTVLDPACGSGAFLIQALQFLLAERRNIAEERERITDSSGLFDLDEVMRGILSRNLYGVDINPESVEITQLALWLHTALPGKPLSNLNEHIRCGNSLVGPDFRQFYDDRYQEQDGLFEELDEQAREDVNVFDWAAAFPDVLGDDVPEEERGFDCVIGNPPYVKLQHFRRLKEAESEYFTDQRISDDSPLYESAQTGNFDIYLLFIEKGVGLMNSEGRMGYIAPSLWLKNQYGLGLRSKIKHLRAMDRWVDFKSFQVFGEATTYTALQFYRKMNSDAIRFHLAHDGDITSIDWSSNGVESISYDELPGEKSWTLAAGMERELLEKLACSTRSLGDESVTRQIFQGLITSRDYVYHLQRISPNCYRSKGGKVKGIEYEIEDEIMHPLVSGKEAKRYQRPDTDTYILFPYTIENGTARIFSANEMKKCFPNAWAYLKKHENELRGRERNGFNDAQWFRFGRTQNLDKQDFLKLLVPRLVSNLCCVADEEGKFYLDNVDVGGVLPVSADDLFFLCGVLNAPVCDFVFRRTSKPFRGETLSANKQYIAPLPIPNATKEQKMAVGDQAKNLQKLHTARRDKAALLKRRLDSDQCLADKRAEDWLWADVRKLKEWKQEAPAELAGRERTAWAKEQRAAKLEAHLDKIDALLRPNAILTVNCDSGEVNFCIESVPVATAYLDENEADFIAAQWREAARNTNVTEKFTAKQLVKKLLTLRKTDIAPLRMQVIKIDAEVQAFDAKIEQAERDMNQFIYGLYNLTEDEIKLVEAG